MDYREVLSPEQFAAFVKLRTLRQTIAKDDAVPVYVIFTNEQLAAMVQKGAASKADLGRIDGVGEAQDPEVRGPLSRLSEGTSGRKA